MEHSIISRVFSEKDKYELNDLYNRFTGRSRTIEQYDWEWLHTPEGQGSMWLLVESNTGKIIGHHGLIPVKFSYFGLSLLAGKTENTLIEKRYTGKGIYLPFEAKFMQEAKDRFQILYTTTAFGGPGRTRQKLGYSRVGDYVTYIKFIDNMLPKEMLATLLKRKLINRSLTSAAVCIIQLLSYIPIAFTNITKHPTIDKAVEMEQISKIEPIAKEIDEFWELNKNNLGITLERSHRYLKWRVFDNPNIPYDFYIFRKQYQLVGYAVITKSAEQTTKIVDIMVANNDEILFNTIIGRITDQLKKDGIKKIHLLTLLSNNILNKVFTKNGFISPDKALRSLKLAPKGNDSPLMAKVLNDNLNQEKLAQPENWYFTEIFFEGVLR